MSNEITTTEETPVEAPVVETALETLGTEAPATETAVPEAQPEPEPEEKTYAYQPTDDEGLPLGGKQVLKYRSNDELVQKLTEQSILLNRKLREETRKRRLGILEHEEIPDTAARMDGLVEFKPKEMSADQRAKLTRDLLDPESLDEATDALFELKFGAKPDALRSTLETLQRDNVLFKVQIESDAFVASTPDYYPCRKNLQTIQLWLERNNLFPSRDNLQKAYETLSNAGVLTERPLPVTPAPAFAPAAVEPTPTPVSEPAPDLPPAHHPRIATGLTRSSATDTGTPIAPGSDIVYEDIVNGQKRIFRGLAAIDRMPSEEYKRRIKTERGFAAKADKLLNANRAGR